jgi:hypothetical protein
MFRSAMLCLVATLSVALSAAWAQGVKKPAGPAKPAAKPAESLQFRMNPHHANVGKVSAVTPEGIVRLADLANPRFVFDRHVANASDLSEGYYLGIIARDFLLSTEDARLIRVQVVDVGVGGAATARVGPDAARNLKAGEDIVLFRPPGSTSAQLKAAPDFAPVESSSAGAPSAPGRLGLRERALLSRSHGNLKQIGIAYHNFHDLHNGAPPAYLADKDGKPLLSWRVLLLPYLEEVPLYQQFRFDEPWDGPNNKKLLDKMPKVYADPLHGETGPYTHYAAITGKNTAFPRTGVKVTDGKNPLAGFKPGTDSVVFGQMVDGLSNTIVIGSVSPEQKIPWTKPEDIELKDDFPPLGKSGSFAAPYGSGAGAHGVFLLGDASVRTIRADIDGETLRRLLTINDGQTIGDYPTLDAPPARETATPQLQMIEIIRSKDGVKARFITAPGRATSAASDVPATEGTVKKTIAPPEPKPKESAPRPEKKPD